MVNAWNIVVPLELAKQMWRELAPIDGASRLLLQGDLCRPLTDLLVDTEAHSMPSKSVPWASLRGQNTPMTTQVP